MVQTWKPYFQFLGDSWLEKKTIPYWERLFKVLGIYNIDFHEKYREYIHSERYETYIKLVEGDIRESIESLNKSKVNEMLKEIFGEKKFTCPDILN